MLPIECQVYPLCHKLYDLCVGIADRMTNILGVAWSTSCVQRALAEAGFVYKCVINQAAEADPAKQEAYRNMCRVRGYVADQYVFGDEVGTVRDVVALYHTHSSHTFVVTVHAGQPYN